MIFFLVLLGLSSPVLSSQFNKDILASQKSHPKSQPELARKPQLTHTRQVDQFSSPAHKDVRFYTPIQIPADNCAGDDCPGQGRQICIDRCHFNREQYESGCSGLQGWYSGTVCYLSAIERRALCIRGCLRDYPRGSEF